MDEFVDAFGGASFVHGSAYYVEGYREAALWLPPQVLPNDDDGHQGRSSGVSVGKCFLKIRKDGEFSPDEPHWYLPLIGVDPFQQARGCGSMSMKPALQRRDREKKLAYLESSNPRNLSLYIRHGFELIGTIQVADSPPVFPMLRKSGSIT